ncbi:patatin-like phospholipase family protein [Thiolapillus sp.]|uniref:patatin-like phospholipase family protein n=3 Tax=Thiolapillus sp. TaxID=2017437 RepID=UPI0025F4A3C0|nr:patatin-like phospholipase family protein [Thiolapillus sp.]
MTRTAGAPIGCQRPSRFWGLGCPKIYHEAEDTLDRTAGGDRAAGAVRLLFLSGLWPGRKEMLGLALSGGGFRATLFHIGSLQRINEAGLLGRIDEFTSVSGGSIIAAQLGLRWPELVFGADGIAKNFHELIVEPLRLFCGRTIDVGVILGGIISPFRHPSDLLIGNYRKHLYGDSTLQDLPARTGGPRFTLYATSLQTGASVVFSHEYLS